MCMSLCIYIPYVNLHLSRIMSQSYQTQCFQCPHFEARNWIRIDHLDRSMTEKDIRDV